MAEYALSKYISDLTFSAIYDFFFSIRNNFISTNSAYLATYVSFSVSLTALRIMQSDILDRRDCIASFLITAHANPLSSEDGGIAFLLPDNFDTFI